MNPPSTQVAAVAISAPSSDRKTARISVTAVVALLLALLSAVLHLFTMADSSGLESVMSLGMAAICIWCGVHLVRTPSVGAWALSGVMATGMVAVHMYAMGTDSQHISLSHELRTPPAYAAHSMSGAMQVTLAVVFLEVIVCVGRLWSITPNSCSVPQRGEVRSAPSHRRSDLE